MIFKVVDRTIEGKFYSFGLADGCGHLAPYYEMEKVIPGQVKDKVAQLMADIKTGKIKVPEYMKPNESDNLDPRKVIHGK